MNQLEKEAEAIDAQLRGLEELEKDIKKKRDEAKNLIDEAYSHPDRFVPQQIDGILEGINDMKEKTDDLVDKVDKIDQDLDQRIKDLANLLKTHHEQKGCAGQIDEDLA